MRDSDGSAACRDGPVVGIPRALTFYKHAAQWVTFFKELGARVVVSPGTSREILEGGIALCERRLNSAAGGGRIVRHLGAV